jgi:hypothetical protein
LRVKRFKIRRLGLRGGAGDKGGTISARVDKRCSAPYHSEGKWSVFPCEWAARDLISCATLASSFFSQHLLQLSSGCACLLAHDEPQQQGLPGAVCTRLFWAGAVHRRLACVYSAVSRRLRRLRLRRLVREEERQPRQSHLVGLDSSHNGGRSRARPGRGLCNGAVVPPGPDEMHL